MATNFVIDTSAVIAVITEEVHKAELVKLTTGADLIAPLTLPAEIGKAFSAMFKQKRIELKQALAAIRAFQATPSALPISIYGLHSSSPIRSVSMRTMRI